MKADNSKCFGCSKKEVEYLQIEDTQSSYALCDTCYKDKKENIKSKYLTKDSFLKRYEEKLKKGFPNYFKMLQFKQNIDKLKLWEKQIHLEDALVFIKNKNYTQQNFQLLGTFFQKKGRNMDKVANQLLNFLNANKFDISNPIQFTEQNKNDKFKDRFYKYLQEIIQKQQFQDIIKYIDAEIENKLSKIPQEFQKVGNEFKDEADEQEQNKYFGYINLYDFKNGKGIFKRKDIIYYGIFECDIFKYGVKFEQISQDEGQFFFGQFVREEIQGFGKMLAYQLDNQIMYQEYEGNFENGLRHGKGKFTWKQNNKTLIYEGDWQKNLQHGEGNITNLSSSKNVQYEEGKLKKDQLFQTFGQQMMGFQPNFQSFDQSQALKSQKISPQIGTPFQNPALSNGLNQIQTTQPVPGNINKIQSIQQQNQRLSTFQVANLIDSNRQIQQFNTETIKFQTPNFSIGTQIQQQQISSDSTKQMQQFSSEIKFNKKNMQTTIQPNQQSVDQQNFKSPCTLQIDAFRAQTQTFQCNPHTQAAKNYDITVKQNIGGISNRQTMSYK
ncbi:unnamed protein product [Paramecium octaurelia]|uniref:MORN repeat-containing protein 3 n=1 Tax=Paramecium octaurelia TaxID=43137 RepID=A0A8S1TPY1_PAROT|nr:unnamed protein product [Paramecium octaurelia]